MATLKAAVFDIDGTLLDSVDLHAEAWRQILVRYGRDASFEKVRSQIGKGGDQLLPVFFTEEELEKLQDEIEEERGKLFKREFRDKLRPFPGVPELFKHMRAQGLKIALASSAKKDELEHYTELLEIDDLFEAGTSSDDAEKSKPHPDIFQAALKKLDDLKPDEVLAIGDTPYDAQAAGKIGIKTVGFLCGGFPEEDLRKAKVIEIYHDPVDLLRQYDQSAFARQRDDAGR